MPDSRHELPDERSAIINIRAPLRQRNLVDQAAQATGKTRTEFMLEAACRAAEEVLIDQRFFQVSEERFNEFVAALDAPVEDNPQLRSLMKRTPRWR